MRVADTAVPVTEFVDRLRHFPQAAFEEQPTLREFLARYPVAPHSLQPYLTWDRQHYTRNLVDKTELYELVAICWEVGQASSIHNHRGQNCWMAVPIGRLRCQNYRVLFEDLQAGRCKLERADFVEMDAARPVAVDPAQPVHKVFNPVEFGERAVSLHLYSRPFDNCDVYSEEQGTCGTIKLSYTTLYGKKS